MKPTTPIDTEMVFLRDVEARLQRLGYAVATQRNPAPELLGLTSVVQCRIAEVTKLREETYDTNTDSRSSTRG